jgi:hyperosmotically inducible periplasmic protein
METAAKRTLLFLITAMGIGGCAQQQNHDVAQTPAPSENNAPAAEASATPTTAPDSTAINTRDQDSQAITAGSQGQGFNDVSITAEIRRRIMNDNLSVNAQNVKVICVNGKVTLRGPVNSQDEKKTIGAAADNVVGADNVDNELDVTPNG